MHIIRSFVRFESIYLFSDFRPPELKSDDHLDIHSHADRSGLKNNGLTPQAFNHDVKDSEWI